MNLMMSTNCFASSNYAPKCETWDHPSNPASSAFTHLAAESMHVQSNCGYWGMIPTFMWGKLCDVVNPILNLVILVTDPTIQFSPPPFPLWSHKNLSNECKTLAYIMLHNITTKRDAAQHCTEKLKFFIKIETCKYLKFKYFLHIMKQN